VIKDVLIPTLKEQFPNRGMKTADPPDPVAVFPAAHPEVGDVVIWDEGCEATLAIGSLTHSHFNPYDESLSDRETAERVTEEVVEFLNALFSDRVVIYTRKGGQIGGWTYTTDSTKKPNIPDDARVYVWLGPSQKASKWKAWLRGRITNR